MKAFKKLKNKIHEMNISTKLRLISSLTLLIPLALSVVCCLIIYLSFGTNEYINIINMFEPVENTRYSYSAFEYIYTAFKEQIEKDGEFKIEKLYFGQLQEEQGDVYLQVQKNGQQIFQTHTREKPENFDELYSFVSNDLEKVYTIINDNILFRITVYHDADEYILFAQGPVRQFYPYEKTASFYWGFLMTNFIIIIAVIIAVLILSKILTNAVFKRVEYSLDILTDGVQKISGGDLDYRIKYDRKDEFYPVCDNFNKMAGRLEESVELIKKQEKQQKEVILGISHDIFSPLTSIKAYVEGLLSGVATTKAMQEKYLDVINKKAEQIERTVSEMLFYSKTESKKLQTSKEKLDISNFIKKFVELNENDYAMKNIRMNISKCEKSIIDADADLLKRVLTNIIDNSGKYSYKPVCHVDISLENLSDKCRLVLSDDGPGVPAMDVDNLFEMFYTVDKARQNPGKSNGIGLSIVSNIIVKVHGGTVKAENKAEGGLSVIIEIPTVKENI